ncbi:MAG: MaoC family dehydratase N-terminal domain-containing protein [Chloroflexi bacterium]|nr:MaoC family dehydratase N-terminal domain-containing protein [Chloroflexota bacterium]
MSQAVDARRAAAIPPLTEEQARRRREYIQRLKGDSSWGFESVPDDFEHTWERTITPEAVRLYTDGVEEMNPWYESESPFGKAIVPPFFLSRESAHCFDPLGPGVGRVHVSHETELLEPILVGTTVRLKAKVGRKYFKRDRRYIDVNIDITDAATGKLLAREKRSVIAEYRKMGEASS